MCLHLGRGQPLCPGVDMMAGSPKANILRHLIGHQSMGRELKPPRHLSGASGHWVQV